MATKKTKKAAKKGTQRAAPRAAAPMKGAPAKKAARKAPARAKPAKAPAARAKPAKGPAARGKGPAARGKGPAARGKGPAARGKAAGTRTKAAVRAKPAVKRAPPAPPARAKPIRRRDGAGHIDPKYAADLLAQSGGREAQARSFLELPRSEDDLAEQLGEEAIETATTGEHEGEDVLDQEVPEERGGPFVESTGATEFAHGTDPSNPAGAKREPFPTT
jgi:hypothetical protein